MFVLLLSILWSVVRLDDNFSLWSMLSTSLQLSFNFSLNKKFDCEKFSQWNEWSPTLFVVIFKAHNFSQTIIIFIRKLKVFYENKYKVINQTNVYVVQCRTFTIRFCLLLSLIKSNKKLSSKLVVGELRRSVFAKWKRSDVRTTRCSLPKRSLTIFGNYFAFNTFRHLNTQAISLWKYWHAHKNISWLRMNFTLQFH